MARTRKADSSFAARARRAGFNPSTIRFRMKRRRGRPQISFNEAVAMGPPMSYRHRGLLGAATPRRKGGPPPTMDSRRAWVIKEAAKIGVLEGTVLTRLHAEWDVEKIITTPVMIDTARAKRVRALGSDPALIYQRMRTGKTEEEAIAMGPPKSKKECVEIMRAAWAASDGQFCGAHSLAAKAREAGQPEYRVHSRVKRGWTEEEALKTPYRGRPPWNKGQSSLSQ